MATTVAELEAFVRQLEQKVVDNDRFYQQRYDADQKALAQALLANDKRLEAMNEFRFALSDQAARLMPRAEVMSMFDASAERGNISRDSMANRLESKISPLALKVDEMLKPNWTFLTSFIAVAGLLVSGMWLIIGLKIDTSVSPITLALENQKATIVSMSTTINERGANREAQMREVNRQLQQVEAATHASQTDIAALRTDQTGNIARLGALETTGAAQRTDLRVAATNVQQKLVEIETQFKSLSHIINLMKDDNHQMFGVLWSKNFPNVKLPDKSFRPNLYNDNSSP